MTTLPSILMAIVSVAAPPQFEVQPLRGAAVSGRLVAVDAKGVTVETAGGRVTWLPSELMGITARPKPAAPATEAEARIDLVDGSLLAAREFTTHNGSARILPRGAVETIVLPLGSLSAVRFQPDTAASRNEWARLLKMKTTGALLVILRGDVVDYHPGAAGDVTEKTVAFDLDGEVVPVKRSKVFGLIYHAAAGGEQSEPVCWLTDGGGSRWAVRTMTLEADKDKLAWTTIAGASASCPLQQVSQIDLSGGKVVYLSDLKPESVAYTPYFPLRQELPAEGAFFRPRQDRNLESKPLRLGGQQFPKGLALHSRTEVVYYLPGRFRRFQAVAGIDDDVRPRGAVHLVLRGDGKVLWEATLSGADKEPSRAIDLDVTGVRRLTVVADFAAASDAAGQVVLGSARVSK
jgi:hypothetical protein